MKEVILKMPIEAPKGKSFPFGGLYVLPCHLIKKLHNWKKIRRRFMRKNMVVFLLIIGSIFVFSSINAEESTYFNPGSMSNRPIEYKNIRAGYLLFKNNCKSCHSQKNEKNAPFLCPESKTKAGWNRVFARENTTVEKHGCLNDLSKEELMDLNDYLYTYASDGKKPDAELGCP